MLCWSREHDAHLTFGIDSATCMQWMRNSRRVLIVCGIDTAGIIVVAGIVVCKDILIAIGWILLLDKWDY